jgi:hypothetical protein
MKKYLIFSLVGVFSLLYANGLQCKEYIAMSNVENSQYIQTFNKQIKLQYFSTDLSTKNKKHMQNISLLSKQLKKCIALKKANKHDLYDGERYKALLTLNGMTLNHEEKSIYKESVEASRKAFSSLSSASLIKGKSKLPLIYLTAQRNNNTGELIVYEQRLLKGKVKMFSQAINPKALKFFSNLNQQKYINYLKERKGLTLTLAKKPKSAQDMMNTIIVTDKIELINNKYIVTDLWFNVKDMQSNKKRTISKNASLIYLKKHKSKNANSDIIFQYQNKNYIVKNNEWKRHTKSQITENKENK